MTLALAEQYQRTRRLVEAGVLPRSALEVLEAGFVDWRGVTGAQTTIVGAAAAAAAATALKVVAAAEAAREAARAAASAKYWKMMARAEAEEKRRLKELYRMPLHRVCGVSSNGITATNLDQTHGLPAWVVAELDRAELNAPDPPELGLVMPRPPWRT